ncbi:Uncharacterised protein [Legionella steigerwaltii]|uniref:Uncharacterized protein n=1 Tax=Legionella steigerwaltii TaxID=460 RepID=A0A378LAP0_9GAMM|nr:hypothetical protein [Legionella steigerwaltii]KTD80932.1 hypothetical protein Lstg_0159 [Legionella steigerwaltii]STY23380.1 Uncharacterised protein [Legionella steigerwaltii]
MKEWLTLFYASNQETTLTLNGKTFKKTDCERIGGGSEKHVYKIKGTNQCFFIPNKGWGNWDNKIQAEKYLLDQITDLGLKTQRFEIAPIEIREPGKPPHTINVLVTKDFESLCEEESIVIYNPKGDQRVIGTPPDISAMKKRLKDKAFAVKMMERIIHEYATAFTFSLPIGILGSLDDSQHFYFKLPPDESNEPPVIGFMFWDVVSDFSGPELPYVPTLEDLKSGTRSKSDLFYHPLRGLEHLANNVACTMLEMSYKNSNNELSHSFAFVKEIEDDLIQVLNNDAILHEALAQARKQGVNFFTQLLNELKDFENKNISPEGFVEFMKSALSLDEPVLLQRAFKIHPNPTDLPKEKIDQIMATATKYGNPTNIDFLNTHLVLAKENIELEKQRLEAEKLKNDFIQKYNAKFTSDQKAWCGFYSFFATSYVNNDMSLKELVEHAQGHSKQGSGKRSQEVMRKMGWLNENNEVSGAISEYLLKI